MSDAQQDIEAVLNGYDQAHYSQPLRLIVGTNNSGWSSSISDLNGSTINWPVPADQFYNLIKSFSNYKDDVEAGIDVEPNFSTPANVMTFVGEFSDDGQPGGDFIPLWDFGSLNGDTGINGTGTYGNSQNGWTAPDFFQLNGGIAGTFPFLEVYNGPYNGYSNIDWGKYNAELDVYCATQYEYWPKIGILSYINPYPPPPGQTYVYPESALQALLDETNAFNTENIPSADQNFLYNTIIEPENTPQWGGE